VARSALTPQVALDYLRELSGDFRAAVLVDADGSLMASSLAPQAPGAGDQGTATLASRLGALVVELFDRAEQVGGIAVSQVEVSTSEGAVFAARYNTGPAPMLGVVTGPSTLSSLMFYDLRFILSDLEVGTR
jgi:predicted regulator of Ras-like GTPase activity (Roadblock/LC7/MglB family)